MGCCAVVCLRRVLRTVLPPGRFHADRHSPLGLAHQPKSSWCLWHDGRLDRPGRRLVMKGTAYLIHKAPSHQSELQQVGAEGWIVDQNDQYQQHHYGKRTKLNFPFLSVHPYKAEDFRSNARLTKSYDQIGIISHDKRLPRSEQNSTASSDNNGFDYGVFNFVELFSRALHNKRLLEPDQKTAQSVNR